jgi:peptidoglycan hydrolase-like protein with peptidoglycan-binding domain
MANGIKRPKYGADADFGAETKAGVIEYQRKMGIAADGIAGPNTWKKLLGLK